MGGEWRCPTCDFHMYLPVPAPSLRVTRLGLYSDARFPGRCLLAFTGHVTHMEDLAPDVLAAFWADAARVGAAVRRIHGAQRVNYAVLGNADPHLHVHIVPRQPSAEPLPTRPPWNDPRPLEQLGPRTAAELARQLTRLLSDPRPQSS